MPQIEEVALHVWELCQVYDRTTGISLEPDEQKENEEGANWNTAGDGSQRAATLTARGGNSENHAPCEPDRQ